MRLILLFFLLFNTCWLLGQTPGLIYYPSGGGIGTTVLNPNGDAWSSIGTTGYISDDILENEIPFQPLPVPYAEPTSDLARGADCRFSDIVRIDEYDSGVYMYSDGTNLMFRFRQGNTIPGSKGYSILIDSDGRFGNNGPNADPNYIPKTTGVDGNPGFEIEIVLETNFQVAIYDVDGRDGFTGGPPVLVHSYNLGTLPQHHQRSVALTNNCDDPDYFHDFYVVLADLYAATGINSSTPLRYAATTVMAPKPAMGGPISDINGGGSYGEVVLYQCGTPIGAAPTSEPPCSCTNPPSINGPIPSGTNVPITGNWSPTSPEKPNTATIEVFVNGTTQGTTTATGGAGWGMTLSGPLVNGDTIYAIAQAVGEGQCDPNPQIIIVSDCNAGNTPAAPVITCLTQKGIEGTCLPNATIDIYLYLGSNPAEQLLVTVTADALGQWGWTGGASTTNDLGACSGQSNSMAEGTYKVTQRDPANPSCPSPATSRCLDRNGGAFPLTGTSPTPTITTNPIVEGSTDIAGTAVTGEIVRLYINGQFRTSVTAAGGTFLFSSVSISQGDNIAITAQSSTATCESAAATAPVSCIVTPPSINANNSGQVAAGTNLAGTSSVEGGTINIYDVTAPTVSLGTATVTGGVWTSAVAAVAGTTYFATVTNGCGTSDFSLEVTALLQTPNRCGVFTNTPYTDQTTAVTGTLFSAVANTTVNLFIDGVFFASTTTNGTTWSIPVTGELYGGAVVTFAVQEAGRMPFSCPAVANVTCAAPPAFAFSPTTLTISSTDGTATFTLSDPTLVNGVLYLIEDQAIPNIDRGVSIFYNNPPMGSSFDLVTFPFTQEGTYNLQIRGMTFNGVGCEVLGLATVIVPDAGIDSITNVLDIDDDEDGIPDVVETCGLLATDFSCVGGDPSYDNDDDGILNYQDPDYCAGGVLVNGVCPELDADGDGIINQFDLDSDNDGIPDLVESGGVDVNGDGLIDGLNDIDGDGLVDLYDNNLTDGPLGTNPCTPQPTCLIATSTSLLLDQDKDGTNEANVDRDNDGVLDQLDLDADNDGIPDVVEAGGVDVNGDGIADNFVDVDGDGFNDQVDGLNQLDVNNNNIADFADVLLTGGVDADGDGIDDAFDASVTGGVDANNDGIDDATTNRNNALQLTGVDTNGDGRADSYPEGDTDGDGVLDQFDLDADNDGIPDVVEAGGTDANGDGIADNFVDIDNDGFNDVVDGDPTNSLITGDDAPGSNTNNALLTTGPDANNDGAPDDYPNGDSDGDGVLNHLDLDADNDGILDVLEAGGTDADSDGLEDGFVDVDGDGLNDNVDGDVGNDGVAENTVNATTATGADTNGDGAPDSYPNDNQDGDTRPNFLDIDSDNDGIVDNTEGQSTANYIAPSGIDTDGDGIDDAYDNNDASFGGAGSGILPNNQDGVDNPDYLDLDTDNDGISDLVEGHDTNGDGVVDGNDTPNANTGIGGLLDTDNDGLLDGFDNNTASTDATNSGQQGNNHPDQSNALSFERDWREANTTFAINDVNTTPVGVAVSGSVSTNDDDYEGNTQTITSVRIDTDGDGIPETVVAVGNTVTTGGVNENQTANTNAGQFVLNDNGTYTFTPTATFEGELTVEYVVCDNGTPQACDNAFLVIDTEPIPSDENGNVAVAPDVNVTYDDMPVSGQVLANDNDAEGDILAVTGTIDIDTDGDGVVDATSPVGALTPIAGVNADGGAVLNAGTLIQNANGTYTFDPAPGFVGTVQYNYTVCDNGVPISCEETTVTIQVLPRLKNSTNANDDEELLDQGTTLSENVLSNDSDVEGDAQVGGVTLVTGPANGTLVLNSDGSYSYTPNDPLFVGNDEFVYSVCDNGTPQVCDTATVYLTVLDVNKDYGDGPGAYGIPYHRTSADVNGDNIPDGATAIWLGSNVDYEEGTLAVGADNFDDAVIFGTGIPGAFPRTVTPNTNYAVEVDISTADADNVFYGMWIDWDNDGVYDDFYDGNIVTTAGFNTAVINITTPGVVNTNDVNIRVRVDDAPFSAAEFATIRTNGEVEDYFFLMNNPLPVELISFTATLQGQNTAVLDWATETELNNAGFEVEHALPSTTAPVFQNIGFVTGYGTTLQTHDYQYIVENMIPGVHYFRLKQVDFDGTFKYTPVRALTVKAPAVKSLFPTVVHEGSPTVFLQVGQDGRYTIEIMTVLGQTVETYEAEMTTSSYHEINFDIERYPAAIYLIRISNGLSSYTEKIRVE